VRLHTIQQGYGNQVRLHWRTFPLIPDQRPGRRCTEHTCDSRQRARAEEPRAQFVPPELGCELPASSLPALTAAKCAKRQGEAAFAAFHQRLFGAHFRDNLDISRPDALWRIACDSGLDLARFQADHANGEAYQAVLHDYAEGVSWFGVSALPTVIFNEKIALVGAVPEENYRLLLDWILASEPGGLIPLEANVPQTGDAGRSAVGQMLPSL
jgi:predicted DsbA family dithiol-disulfide isomerase